MQEIYNSYLSMFYVELNGIWHIVRGNKTYCDKNIPNETEAINIEPQVICSHCKDNMDKQWEIIKAYALTKGVIYK